MSNETDAVATVANDIKKRAASGPNFHARLLNKQISIKGQTGTTISGVLRGFSRYDLLVEIDNDECILVSKGAVLSLSSPELANMKAPGPKAKAPVTATNAQPVAQEFPVTRCRP
jgi:hypothetical protein